MAAGPEGSQPFLLFDKSNFYHLMKSLAAILFSCLMPFLALAQTGTVQGTVTDQNTGETLIGATVMYASGKGTVTDINGQYTLTLPYGNYTLQVAYVGFEDKSKEISVSQNFTNVDFALESTSLQEVEVFGDVAVEKETPVAYTNIKPAQLKREVGTGEVAMLLNTVPGVYVSPSGGSDGGVKLNIRGFKERNVSVLVDGIPINNMDNGSVFWPNTYGLDAVLSNLQVQRGLASSKLALPAIGGTVNYILKSIDQKESFHADLGYGSFNSIRGTVGYNSGRLENGWGFSVAGSFRKSDGYSVNAFREEFFYYGKVQKELGSHLLSLTAFGAPVRYGQRTMKNKIVVYDKNYAADLFQGSDELYRQLATYSVTQNLARQNGQYGELNALAEAYGWGYYDENGGFVRDPSYFNNYSSDLDFIDTTGVISKGFDYNPEWGELNGEVLNESERTYHKPIISLRDFWKINERLYLSNVLYYSSGFGGYTNRVPSLGAGDYDENLQVDFDDDYRGNTVGGIFGPPIYPLYDSLLLKSGVILDKTFDNHYWAGWIGTLDFQVNDIWTISGGLDFRYYRSERFKEVHNLLGGDYYVPALDDLPEDRPTTPEYQMFREGDKYGYHSENRIRWGAFFTEAKYKNEKWSGFINLSGVISGYKHLDYFGNRDFIASDGTRFANAIGYGDVLFYNGSEVLVAAGIPQSNATITQSGDTTWVTNPDNNFNDYAPTGQHYIVGAERVEFSDSRTRTSETPWKNIPGFTIKGGMSYSFLESMSAYVNLGYLSRTPRFSNVIDLSRINQFYLDIENEKISSAEVGYNYRSKKFAGSFSAYYTIWKNRPYEGNVLVKLPGRDILVKANINAMNARHMGLEFEGKYQFNKYLSVDAFVSLGDWIWTSKDTVNFYDDNGRIVNVWVDGRDLGYPLEKSFDAQGVYVGDSPQTQLGGSATYNFVENAYLKGRITYFARHFSDFDPLGLEGEKAGRQSWMIPNYYLIDLFAGYDYKMDKVTLSLSVYVKNLLDVRYITDAQNNAGASLVYTDYMNNPPQATVSFDANSAAVYFGLPRTFGVSARVTL